MLAIEMLNKPFVGAIGSGSLVFLTSLGARASVLLGAGETPDINWFSLLEKAGTVAVCMWMLLYFQKKLDQKDVVIQELTKELLKAVDKLGDAINNQAKATELQAEAIRHLKA